MSKFSKGEVAAREHYAREIREAISRVKADLIDDGIAKGMEPALCRRQINRHARSYELYLQYYETGDPKFMHRAHGKLDLKYKNQIRVFTAHKILADGGIFGQKMKNPHAAKHLRTEFMPPHLQKRFSEKKIIEIRNEIDRRFGKKPRKSKKAERTFLPDPRDGLIREAYRYAIESIEACQGDPMQLAKLLRDAIDELSQARN